MIASMMQLVSDLKHVLDITTDLFLDINQVDSSGPVWTGIPIRNKSCK